MISLDLCESRNTEEIPEEIMAKILFLFFVLLTVTHGIALINLSDEVILSELEDLDAEEGDEAESFDLPKWETHRGNKILVNVDSFGAVGDGASDDTKVICSNVL